MFIYFDSKNQRNIFWKFFLLFLLGIFIEGGIKGDDEVPIVFLCIWIGWIFLHSYVFWIFKIK
jgi:hypothetical protein